MRREAPHADLDEGDQVFVTNGFTYGGGVEKNFGWLRAVTGGITIPLWP
jgi:hypothetical protein